MKTTKAIRKDAHVMEKEIRKMIKVFHEKHGEGCTLGVSIEYEYSEFPPSAKQLTGIDVKVNVNI